MGRVYQAIEIGSERRVALKELTLDNAAARALFEREYHTLASIKHPSVIDVYDFGITREGKRYFTMQLLEGGDIMALAPIHWRKACEYLRDVASSLALLHARALVHRDVSPRNVRLDTVGGRAKLLDFGALTPFGVAPDVVGTPVCMAPETMRQLELDGRTDLYSLGVVAYWMLTGKRPFPIRTLADVGAPHPPPVPLSQQVDDVPRPLEHLITSLISADPRGRPSNASEVITRLATLAGLEDSAVDCAADVQVVSPALCGRERERAQLLRRLRSALAGHGGAIMLEGAAGMGRSRLVEEVLIQAQLLGFTCLRVDGLADTQPTGALGALARNLLRNVPAVAKEALGQHGAVLTRAFPELDWDGGDRAPAEDPGGASLDPVERNGRIQSAFVSWVLAISEQLPIVAVVDDAHGCDAMSAGALVALAHAAEDRRILLVTAHRTEAAVPVAVKQLGRISARIKLRGLSSTAMEELVGSAFGEVPNQTRLAHWLYSLAGGNPGQSLELLNVLIERETIRYKDGVWELPAGLGDRDAPASLEDALTERLALLGPVATEVARLCALNQGSLSLAICGELLPDVGRAELFAALDELSAREVVVGTGERYRLRQEALRPILLQALPVQQMRRLHLGLAHAMMADHRELLARDATAIWWGELSPGELSTLLQAGWHLLRGGDRERAREILLNAGMELSIRGAGLAEALPALEAAYEFYREAGRPLYEYGHLLVPLTLPGTHLDFRLCYRYGGPILLAQREVTGFALASKLSRYIGKRVALSVAVPFAWLRYQLMPSFRIGRSFRGEILGVISIGTAMMGTALPMLDGAYARHVLESLELLSAFPQNHRARVMYEIQRALAAAIDGHYEQAERQATWLLAMLEQGVRGIADEPRKQLEAGLLALLGSLHAGRIGGDAHADADKLDRLHISFSRQSAAGVRAHYHGYRGEQAQFERYQREVDVLAAQAGSTWRQDVLIPRSLWWTYALCNDVLGLKHCARQLQVLAAEVSSLATLRDAAWACYLSVRGHPGRALAEYGEVLEAASADPTVVGIRYAGVLARILRQGGKPERARQVCEAALAHATPTDLAFFMMTFGTQLELALALADLGQHRESAEQLEDMLAGHAVHDNPLLHGLTHLARAQVALQAEHSRLCSQHLGQAYMWFERSGNPALIAQVRQLAEEARAAGVISPERRVSRDPMGGRDPELTVVRRALDVCRGPDARLQAALDLVISRAGAERGYLYLCEGTGLYFAAPRVGLEPPEELANELLELLAAASEEPTMNAKEEADLEGMLTRTMIAPEDDSYVEHLVAGHSYRAFPLLIRVGTDLVAIGVIALVQSELALAPIPAAFLEELAQGVYDAGDVETAHRPASRDAQGVRRDAG